MPWFVIGSVAFDEWLFVVGDVDIRGFGDGDFLVGEYGDTVVITDLTDGKEWCLCGWNSVTFRGCWRQFRHG